MNKNFFFCKVILNFESTSFYNRQFEKKKINQHSSLVLFNLISTLTKLKLSKWSIKHDLFITKQNANNSELEFEFNTHHETFSK